MILDDNAVLVTLVVKNVIPNSVFSTIAPVGTIEDIMVEHPVLIPILLPAKIQIMVAGSLNT